MSLNNKNSKVSLEKNTFSSPLPHTQQQTNFQPENPYAMQKSYPTSPPALIQDKELINYNHLSYALYAVSFFTGITWFFAIILNYVKRDQAQGTWLYSHFDWQIKTLLYSVFFGFIATMMMVMGFGGFFIGSVISSDVTMGSSGLVGLMGILLMGVVVFWYICRIVRGWIALTDHRPVP